MATWRDKYKAAEQAFMVERERYSEVARALGFEGDAWFGDPLVPHTNVVERAKEFAARCGVESS